MKHKLSLTRLKWFIFFGLVSSSVNAANLDELNINIGGFIRADLGIGDRYTELYGEDNIGVSKAALAISSNYENIEGIFVIGTEVTTSGNASDDGDIDIKDAFIVINDFLGLMTLSVGAQPLLFGLKPNGYPGDSSLQSSVEYGANGLFAAANQAGPSLIAKFGSDSLNLRFGLFDQSGYSNTVNEGSGFEDNYFIELNLENDAGLYASLGYESLYRATTEQGEPIIHFGAGFKADRWDISAEYVQLDEVINGTADDDQYIIAELGYKLNQDWRLYLDWSESDTTETARLGAKYKWNEHFFFTAEYANDELVTGDVDSFDIRFTLEY